MKARTTAYRIHAVSRTAVITGERRQLSVRRVRAGIAARPLPLGPAAGVVPAGVSRVPEAMSLSTLSFGVGVVGTTVWRHALDRTMHSILRPVVPGCGVGTL